MSELLTFDKVSLSLGGKQLLESLDLSLKNGEVKVIMGPSGCGTPTNILHMNTPPTTTKIKRG